MMVGMAALQVLVVRFFFQGARKGKSKRAWDRETAADESRIRVNLVHHTGRELRHIMISMSNYDQTQDCSSKHLPKALLQNRRVRAELLAGGCSGSLLLDLLRYPGSSLPVSNELLKIRAPA